MATAWVIIISHLESARHDLTKITSRTIPEWVNGAIYGTVILFWSFSVVQIIFQRKSLPEHLPRIVALTLLPLAGLPPGFYWGTELIYCILSLTAKLYLGFFLLINVILTDGSVQEALAPAGQGYR